MSYHRGKTKTLGWRKPTIRVGCPLLELVERVADGKPAPLQLDRDNIHHAFLIAHEKVVASRGVTDAQRLVVHVDNDARRGRLYQRRGAAIAIALLTDTAGWNTALQGFQKLAHSIYACLESIEDLGILVVQGLAYLLIVRRIEAGVLVYLDLLYYGPSYGSVCFEQPRSHAITI